MKFGLCLGTDIERMKIAKELGFDYCESNCGGIVKSSEEHIAAMKAVGIPVLAANCFIGLRVVGEERDNEKIAEYLEILFARGADLGISRFVFGSSGARRIPDGMSLSEGRAQIADFLKNLVAPLAQKYNIPVAIEPLRPAECNAINTIAHGIEIARAVDSPYIKVLADVKHMYEQGEDFEQLRQLKDMIIHSHTSNPHPDPTVYGDLKRIYPKAGDGFNQADFIEPLKSIGVEFCSVEADVVDFYEDAKAAVELLSAYK